MAQLQALLLCDLVVTTPEGKVQLQGLFDVINTVQLPTRHGRMWVFFRFLMEEEDWVEEGKTRTMTLFLRRPSGETESLPQMEVKIGHQGTVQGYVQLQGLPLKQKGEHWLELFYGETRVGRCRFFVRLTQPQKVQAQPVAGSTTVH